MLALDATLDVPLHAGRRAMRPGLGDAHVGTRMRARMRDLPAWPDACSQRAFSWIVGSSTAGRSRAGAAGERRTHRVLSAPGPGAGASAHALPRACDVPCRLGCQGTLDVVAIIRIFLARAAPPRATVAPSGATPPRPRNLDSQPAARTQAHAQELDPGQVRRSGPRCQCW